VRHFFGLGQESRKDLERNQKDKEEGEKFGQFFTLKKVSIGEPSKIFSFITSTNFSPCCEKKKSNTIDAPKSKKIFFLKDFCTRKGFNRRAFQNLRHVFEDISLLIG
jgi:hypothetical protein